jgi:AraC-like DNA-binding protein
MANIEMKDIRKRDILLQDNDMKIIRDKMQLDPAYPFTFSKQILKKSDNCEDSFHWHSYFEITYVECGRGHYLVNGKKYSMSAGDIIIFNNVEPHGWIVEEEDMLVYVTVFATEFISDHVNSLGYEYLKPLIERGSNFKNKIDKEDLITGQLITCIQEISKEWESKEQGYRLMIKSDVLRMLTLLFRYYQNTDSQKESLLDKNNAMKRLQEVFIYMEHHYSDKILLEDMAKSVFMSPNYFSAYFRKVTGYSFSEYLSILRILNVKERMKTSDKSITEIAVDCGFNNMSNFYRQYKKVTGSTPRSEA